MPECGTPAPTPTPAAQVRAGAGYMLQNAQGGSCVVAAQAREASAVSMGKCE
eukprot:SAG11_NODE_34948_length_269_cov_0.611765_1_plen_51_part_10